MRRMITLLSAVVLFSIPAAAQGIFGVGGSGPVPIHPSSTYPHDWDVSVGYQYDRINLLGTPFNMNGFNASVSRYLGNWIGAEADFAGGAGNTGNTTSPANLDARSIFIGAGPRFAARRHGSIVPWAHVLGGMEHLQFTPSAGMLSSNTASAIVVGGGADIHLNGLTTIRLEADETNTRFFGLNQRHFQLASGLVFGF